MQKLKSMWLNNKSLVGCAFAVGAILTLTSPASAGGEIEITPEREKACAKAQARYQELYPDAKDDGTVIVKLYKYNFCPILRRSL